MQYTVEIVTFITAGVCHHGDMEMEFHKKVFLCKTETCILLELSPSSKIHIVGVEG